MLAKGMEPLIALLFSYIGYETLVSSYFPTNVPPQFSIPAMSYFMWTQH